MCVVFKLNAQFAHTTQELAGFRIGFFLQQKWQQKRGVGEEKEEELEENGREECVHLLLLLLLLRLHKKGLSVLFSKSHEELLKHFSFFPLYLLLCN